MRETKLTLNRRVPDEKRLAWAQGGGGDDRGARTPGEAASLRPRGALPPRRAPARARAPGHPDRRPGDHGDPERGLRPDRVEAQGPEPAGTDLQHRAGQRRRGLHPAARAAPARAAIPPGRPAPPAWRRPPSRRSSRPCSACSSRSPASRAAGPRSRTARMPRPSWPPDPSPTGGSATWTARPPPTPPGNTPPPTRRASPCSSTVPRSTQFSGDRTINRAAHFAGGRLRAELEDLGESYSVEMWLWNGLPTERAGHHRLPVRSRLRGGRQGRPPRPRAAPRSPGAGSSSRAGEGGLAGMEPTEIPLKTWNHVLLVREGRKVTVYPQRQGGDPGRGRGRRAGGRLFFGGQTASSFLGGQARRDRRLRQGPVAGPGGPALPGGAGRGYAALIDR